MEIFYQNTIFFLQVVSACVETDVRKFLVLFVNFVYYIPDSTNRIPFNQSLDPFGKSDQKPPASHCRPGIERDFPREAV